MENCLNTLMVKYHAVTSSVSVPMSMCAWPFALSVTYCMHRLSCCCSAILEARCKGQESIGSGELLILINQPEVKFSSMCKAVGSRSFQIHREQRGTIIVIELLFSPASLKPVAKSATG